MNTKIIFFALVAYLAPNGAAQSLSDVLDNIRRDGKFRDHRISEPIAPEILFASEIEALELKPIEEEPLYTYRLILHLWHANIGSLSLHCPAAGDCKLTIARTDGYGTYQVGELLSKATYRVERQQGLVLAKSVSKLTDMPEQTSMFEQGRLCVHAPQYVVQKIDAAASESRYRHCMTDMWDHYVKIACPLIEHAWTIDPEAMDGIDPNRLCPDIKEQTNKEDP